MIFYADLDIYIFFIPKRDNHDVFVLFSYDFESAEEKKGLDWFFWLGEQKKFLSDFLEKSLVEMTLWFS